MGKLQSMCNFCKIKSKEFVLEETLFYKSMSPVKEKQINFADNITIQNSIIISESPNKLDEKLHEIVNSKSNIPFSILPCWKKYIKDLFMSDIEKAHAQMILIEKLKNNSEKSEEFVKKICSNQTISTLSSEFFFGKIFYKISEEFGLPLAEKGELHYEYSLFTKQLGNYNENAFEFVENYIKSIMKLIYISFEDSCAESKMFILE